MWNAAKTSPLPLHHSCPSIIPATPRHSCPSIIPATPRHSCTPFVILAPPVIPAQAGINKVVVIYKILLIKTPQLRIYWSC
ncbi:hypothetical protein KJ953_03135 [Patescibacteria group bacterium]|nr:hypothetical protein [Patescibacteria group bacterium]